VTASLLLSEGHLYANRYPLSKLWYEADLVRERVNRNHVTEVTILSTVMASRYGGRAAGQNIKDLIRKLENG
jgi:hypothetical protein